MENLEILPIRVRVASVLRKSLLAGEFAPGQELSLTETAAQLGVSRTPVREAFQTLADEGLLQLRMNRGAVVTPIDEKFICDHFEMRMILERAAVALAMQRGSCAGLLALQTKAEADWDAMREEDYRAYNQQLHTMIWQMAGNDKLYHALSALWNGPSSATQARDRAHERCSLREHRQLLDCMAAGDTAGAQRAMDAHLARSRDNILQSFRAKG